MSKKSFEIQSINQVHQALGLAKPKHPLVSVIQTKDFKPTVDFKGVKVINHLYEITLKGSGCGNLQYGKNSYDYEEGTLVFTAPGQVTYFDNDLPELDNNSLGWSLAFHPDLIRKSSLAKKIDQYTFFDYEVSEALHLSEDELKTLEDISRKIEKEYSQNLDRHSQNLIVSNLELFLDYCTRFYDRQFYTRTNLNSDLISQFERLLKNYYQENREKDNRLPSIQYFANKLNFSPNYLSDLLKKETGKTGQEQIHLYVMRQAKKRLLNSSESISEIAYDLGFEYPQHFSNLFKSKTGYSPTNYRKMN